MTRSRKDAPTERGQRPRRMRRARKPVDLGSDALRPLLFRLAVPAITAQVVNATADMMARNTTSLI